jgi:hypothetical protein
LFEDPQGRINNHQNKIPCWPPLRIMCSMSNEVPKPNICFELWIGL